MIAVVVAVAALSPVAAWALVSEGETSASDIGSGGSSVPVADPAGGTRSASAPGDAGEEPVADPAAAVPGSGADEAQPLAPGNTDAERLQRVTVATLAVEQLRADIRSTRAALDTGAETTPLLAVLRADVNRLRSAVVDSTSADREMDALANIENILVDFETAKEDQVSVRQITFQALDEAVLQLEAAVQSLR